MANKTRMEEIAEKMQRGENKQLDPREIILQNISKGCVIPVISDSFRMEQIFQELAEDDQSTVVEGLIAQWARQIGYPMQDSSNLAQVAQYYFVERNDDLGARTEILSFMKKFLWNMANTDVDDPTLAAGLQGRIEEMLFSDLVKELEEQGVEGEEGNEQQAFGPSETASHH